MVEHASHVVLHIVGWDGRTREAQTRPPALIRVLLSRSHLFTVPDDASQHHQTNHGQNNQNKQESPRGHRVEYNFPPRTTIRDTSLDPPP
jgi:hypothetical protein